MFPLFTPKTDPRSFGPKTQRLLEGGDREEGQRARVSGSRQKWEGGPGGCRWVSVNCFVFFYTDEVRARFWKTVRSDSGNSCC